MDVSVIIPTFNRLPFLKRAVASVLQQSRSPRELIIVDDGSDDGTWEWLQKLSPKKIKVFRKEREGPGVARNFGVARAGGEWVAFLDSDDEWLPQKLQTQIEFLLEHPQCRLCQTEEIWIRNGIRVNSKLKHRKYSGDIFPQCLPLCIISPSAVVMEKKLFEKLGGFDPDFPVCEDYELWLRASLKTQVMTLPEALTLKRGGHPDQLSKSFWGLDRFRVKALKKLLATEELTGEQRDLVNQEIQKKMAILAKGFAKRNPGEVNPWIRNLPSPLSPLPQGERETR